ncbi:alkaline phosphatase [Enterococcus faecalis]|nr:alkaline phosphatase [Enterococcus faecalis]
MGRYEGGNKEMKKRALLGVTLLTFTTLAGCTNLSEQKSGEKQTEVAEAKASESEKAPVKNVIFMIGDGMGNPYTTGYRYFKANHSDKRVPQTAFDTYLVGQQATYPEDEEENVTDSASAATAMAAGVKTYNNAIALDNDKSKTETVLERAKKVGKSTGLVATSEITHATPAAYGAHNVSRKNMAEIADDYFDDQIDGQHKVDVLLGGGSELFARKDRDLVKEFSQAGYGHVTDKKSLNENQDDKILGLFAPGGLPKMIDRTEEVPSLADMTESALQRLDKNEKGFFLMVEGSQIDWAGHSNDIVGAMSEMQDFEAAFEKAIDFAKKDGETLVVTTADHSTGGLSLGKGDQYNWLTEPLHAAKRTPDFMAEEIIKNGNVEKTVTEYIDFQLSEAELKAVKTAAESKDVEKIAQALRKIFDERSNTGWTTGGHTGEDVNVYAYGPQAEAFSGQIDNTDQAKIIFGLVDGTGQKAEIKDKGIGK